MKSTTIIVTEQHRLRAVEIIKSLPLDPRHEVIVREYKRDRSAEQNSLYWKWLTVIGNELGEIKEDLHERYKEKFLINIYERDDQGFAEMIQSLRQLYQDGMKLEALYFRKKIISMTSTTTATVAQMSEYMTSIEHDAASLAIRLPHPDERGA